MKGKTVRRKRCKCLKNKLYLNNMELELKIKIT